MANLLKFCIFILNLGFIATDLKTELTNNAVKGDKRRITYTDVLAEGLRAEKWEKEEKACLDTILMTLENAKNGTLWAVWLLDSIQLPVGQLYGSMHHLGHYDQCFDRPSKDFGLDTQYCLATVYLTEATERYTGHIDPGDSTISYLKKYTIKGRDLSVMRWGVCLPKNCATQSVAKILTVVLQASHLGSIGGTDNVSIENCHTTTLTSYSSEYYIFILLIIFLVITVLCCSYYVKHKSNEASKSFGGELIRCFCIRRNMCSLTHVRKDEIFVMNIIRIVIAMAVVGMHAFTFFYGHMTYNGLYLDLVAHVTGPWTSHLEIGLDTFLAMSGLLLMKAMMNNPNDVFKYIWKRYVRLVGGLGMILFYISSVSHHVGDGPVWTAVVKEQEMCARHGWLNLLMLNNYIGADKMCYPISWYIACDYQLTVLGVILFYIYQRNRRIGMYVCTAVLFIAMVSPGVVTYWNKLPPLVFDGFESIREFRNNVVFTTVYMQAHHRVGGFLVGMYMGYVMSVYKPLAFRHFISKKWSFIVLTLCVIVKVTILNLGNYFYEHQEPVLAAIFLSFNKILWALASCIVIAIFEYGTLPGIKWASVLVPLSRLTYGLYLIHVLILQRNVYSMRTPTKFDVFEKMTSTLGVTILALFLSLALWLLVEAPVVNIANLLFDEKSRSERQKVQCNGNSHEARHSRESIDRHEENKKC